VAAEKVVVQKNYQQEQIDFILKHAPSTRSWMVLLIIYVGLAVAVAICWDANR
jgi:hypothetical protein